MSIKIIFSVLALITTVVCIAAVYVHLSLWFLWYLLPDGNIKVAVNSSNSGSSVITELVSASFPEDIIKLLNNSKRYSYIQTNDFSSIALVPKNPFLFKDRNLLIEELNDKGWNTINYGLLIVGTTEDMAPRLSSLRSAVVSAWGKFFSRQHPYKPIVIAQSSDNSIPLLSGKTALVGVATSFGRELKIVSASDLESLPNFSISRPALSKESDYLALNIPGSTVQSISSVFSKEWNEVLYDKLGFYETKPPIIGYMADEQTTSITITNEKAAVAIIGDPDVLIDTFRQWMEDEEAYSRPQKQAFKLPDGTIGYELVKGDQQQILADADSLGCLEPLSDAIKLWLCVSDKGAAAATDKAAAMQELSSISSSVQRIALGSDYLQHIDFFPVKRFKSLAVYSSGEYTILTVRLEE